jgi:hypothetical protein
MTQPLDKNWVPIGEAWLKALERMTERPPQPANQKPATERKEKAA